MNLPPEVDKPREFWIYNPQHRRGEWSVFAMEDETPKVKVREVLPPSQSAEEEAEAYKMRFDKEDKFRTSNSGDANHEKIAFLAGYARAVQEKDAEIAEWEKLHDLAVQVHEEEITRLREENENLKTAIANYKSSSKSVIGDYATLQEELKREQECVDWYAGDTSGKERSHWIDHKFVVEDKFGMTSWDDGLCARETQKARAK